MVVELAQDTPVSYTAILSNVSLWKLALIYFCFQCGVTGYSIWLPTLIKALTKSGMTAVGFLSCVPYFAAMVGLYAFEKQSDKKAIAGCGSPWPVWDFRLFFSFPPRRKR